VLVELYNKLTPLKWQNGMESVSLFHILKNVAMTLNIFGLKTSKDDFKLM
jgi:hypothetical protein